MDQRSIQTQGLGDDANEMSASGADANREALAQTCVTAEFGVHFEGIAHARATALRAALDLLVMQVVGNAQSSVAGTFAGAPTSVAPFSLTDRLDRGLLKVTPSLTISHPNGLDVRVGASYAVSARSRGFNTFLNIGKKL